MFTVVGNLDGTATAVGAGCRFGGSVDFYGVLGPPGGEAAFVWGDLYGDAGCGEFAGEFEAEILAFFKGVADAVVEIE